MVPFENSTNGPVVFTLDLFADRAHTYTDISVCGEAYLDVHHYLLGSEATKIYDSPGPSGTSTPTLQVPNPLLPRTQPLKNIGQIKRIYSHPQAFGQCEIFLSAYLKGVERIDVSSTSKAAELVKDDKTGTSAAIASQIASEIHNLDVLAKGIEDRDDNTTRFFVVRNLSSSEDKETAQPSRSSQAAWKSLVSFTVDHRSPGALADVLDCFRRYRLNLTSINSRPSRVVPFQYIFFVEFEGSKSNDACKAVEGALESLGKVAQTWRLLGSWEVKLRPSN